MTPAFLGPTTGEGLGMVHSHQQGVTVCRICFALDQPPCISQK